MKTWLSFTVALVVLLGSMWPHTAASARPALQVPEAAYDVIINEWSQGHGGNQEWVELLVTTGPLNMQGWTLSDANGSGTVTFSGSAVWQSVPAGTLIVIYNAADRDSSLPADDSDLNDCVVVIPHNNATYFSGGWPEFSNTNQEDNPHLRDAGGVTVHNYSTAPGNTSSLHPGSGQCTYYIGDTRAGVTDLANWAADQSADSSTPGSGNGGANTTWIAGLSSCDVAPTVSSTTPGNGATNVALNANLTVSFSEPVNLTEGWYAIDCPVSGSHVAAVSGGPTTWTVNPITDFGPGESCTATVFGSHVTDQDSNQMVGDRSWSWTVTNGAMCAGDLFFSEYVEGSSNNKAVEIVNATGSTINLAGYNVAIYYNGSSSPTSIALSGTVDDGAVHVLCHSSASALMNCTQQGNLSFNGDDAVALRWNTTVIDVIGQIGYDPGTEWGSGLTSTADNTLRRKSTVTAGDTNGGDAFDPAIQWDGYAVDTFDGLGSHSLDCIELAPAVAATTPANGEQGVATNADLSVNLSEAVNTATGWFSIVCSASGSHTAAVSGGPTSFTLNPNTDFALGDNCTATIVASQVTDQDTIDPPDSMAASYSWTFAVVATESAPTVSGTIPPNGATGVRPNADIVVGFSENVNVAGAWYSIYCASSGAHSAVATGGPQSFTLNPAADFTPLETCTVTIYGAQVTDQDGNDPPDTMPADHSWSFAVGSTAPAPCGQAYTSIFTLQGSGTESSQTGSRTTEGIVVGDFQDTTTQLSGFFLQDALGDGNPASSDGIFVANSTYAVSVGDYVRVTGTVEEYGTSPTRRTQIRTVTALTVCGSGYSITPTPVTLPIPGADALYLEKYEGMLITWPQELYVTENYNLGRYGEVVLSSGSRLWQPTNVVLPGSAAVALQAENDRNRIILDDDNLTQNADPIDHPSPGLTAANTLRSGDTVTGLTGCLSQGTSGYTGTNNYRVHPTVAPPFVHAHPRPAAPEPPGGTITVASFNVLNYFNGDGQGGGFPTSRGAETLEEFNRQRDKIIPAIVGLQADVIGLMEIENDSGAYSAIQDLVNGLNQMEGPGTYNWVDTGVMGTDEIRVSLIYRPARVTAVGAYMKDTDPVNSRPTLAQTFEQVSTGERFKVVVNHFKSKGCTGATGDDADQGDGQGCYNARRVDQATRLDYWINNSVIPASGGDPDVIIIGDLNSYALEDPITTLTGLGYYNLVNRSEGLYTYSYVYMGQAGYLDHALATASILPQVTHTGHWHINPDEPYVLDYNVNYKSPGQLASLYAADPYRSSDHDPVLIGLYPFDFSDLEPGYGTAWHGGNGTLMLGTRWTPDPTFGPDTDNATDDGMTMSPTTGWEPGATVRIYAKVTGGSGYLAGWFDWNNNGNFNDALEKSVAQTVNQGDNTIDLAIPADAGYATGRDVTVRFRLYPGEPQTLGSETPAGGAPGGETEDSKWTPPLPTRVELVRFEAVPQGSAVRVEWETATEIDNLGFNLYRADSPDAEPLRLNETLIPSQAPGSPVGAVYTWLDDGLRPGRAYYYWLEDVDVYGVATRYGPVMAVIRYQAYLPAVRR